MRQFCSQCGVRLDADAFFCTACGAEVVTPASAGASGVSLGATHVDAYAGSAHPLADVAGGRTATRWIWATAFAGTLAVGYVFATPYIVLHGARSALERQDYTALLDIVDADSLKRSLVMGVQAALHQVQSEEAEVGFRPNRLLQPWTSRDAPRLLNEGIERLLTRGLSTQVGSSTGIGARAVEALPPGSWGQIQQALVAISTQMSVSMGYVGVNDFRVRVRHPDTGAADLLFRRDGLMNWRLAVFDGTEALAALLRQTELAASARSMAAAAVRSNRPAVAERWLRRAGHRLDDEGRFRLAALQLAQVDARTPQADEAQRNATWAAEAGHPGAMTLLAREYQSGRRMGHSPLLAAKWLEQLHGREGSDRWSFALARLHASGRDYARALIWMDRAVHDPPYLPPSMRQDFNARAAIAERKRTYARYRDELQALRDAHPDLPQPPAWLQPLTGSEPQPGVGWGPLRLGLFRGEVVSMLGPPTGFRAAYGGGETLIYTAYVTHGATMELRFNAQAQLSHLLLRVAPDAAVPALPPVGRSDAELVSQAASLPEREPAPGCATSDDDLIAFAMGRADDIYGRARRVQRPGMALHVCRGGFVSGLEIFR